MHALSGFKASASVHPPPKKSWHRRIKMNGYAARASPEGCSLLLPWQAIRPLPLFSPMLDRVRWLEQFFFSPRCCLKAVILGGLGYSREHLPALCDRGLVIFVLSISWKWRMEAGVESLLCNSGSWCGVVGRGSLSPPRTDRQTDRQRLGNNVERVGFCRRQGFLCSGPEGGDSSPVHAAAAREPTPIKSLTLTHRWA